MTLLRTSLLGLAVLGAATMIQSVPGTSFSGQAWGKEKVIDYTCMTDDGYGRKRPCSAAYKAANPNWRGGDDCFTDEGYGRYTPCDVGGY